MGSTVSIQQFREAILDVLGYNPRKERYTHDHQSAGLFNASGEKIAKINVKFFIQEDGGSWDDLIKPEFIWDFKKINAGYVIDDGKNTTHLDLKANSAKETSDGIYFIGHQRSYLESRSLFNFNSLDRTYILFNAWFTPQYNTLSNPGQIISIQDSLGNIYFSVSLVNRSTTEYIIECTDYIGSTKSIRDIGETLLFNFKQNIQIYYCSNTIKVYLNGNLICNFSGGLLNFENPSLVNFGQYYRGEISYITMNFNSTEILTPIIQKMFKFKYPLPRQKEYVDLSEIFETNGKNLFIEAKSISKAIESIKGHLYMKTNSIKLRN
jgi:hypothetical protein